MTRHILLVACLAFGAGCGSTFSMSTPPGFVELDPERSRYDYRATTADGLVLAVRELEHEPQGAMEFWVRAIENRMRGRGGYALLETLDVKSADGVAGKQLRFGHDDEGARPHLYYVTVFVTPERLLLVEAGGTKEQMVAQAAEIDKAVAALRTR